MVKSVFLKMKKTTKPTLHFEWDMLDSNDLPKEFFGDDFFELAGDILYHIMDEQLNEDNLQYVDTDDRENNIN